MYTSSVFEDLPKICALKSSKLKLSDMVGSLDFVFWLYYYSCTTSTSMTRCSKFEKKPGLLWENRLMTVAQPCCYQGIGQIWENCLMTVHSLAINMDQLSFANVVCKQVEKVIDMLLDNTGF